ncbi:MAG: murein biosynthesis integral membrane protein MurJ [Planctomycetota bacterium]
MPDAPPPNETPTAPDAPGPDTTHPTSHIPHQKSFLHHATTVAALTLASRLTGLARDAVLAAAFGLGLVADAFFLGFLVPNLFRRLFGEGALTAAFIPNYTTLRQADPAAAARFAKLCVAGLAAVTGILVLLGELAVFLLMQHDGWSEKGQLALLYTALMLPYLPLVCGVAFLAAVLQVHGRFGPGAAAPVLLNLAMIAAATLGIATAADQPHAATYIAAAVVAAGLGQLAWLFLTTRQHLTAGGPGFAHTKAPLKKTALMLGPMLLGLAVFQLNALFDALLAFFLAPPSPDQTTTTLAGYTFDAPVQTGAVAALQWAQRLYQFPLGVFGIALATAIFPALAAAAASQSPQKPKDSVGSPPQTSPLKPQPAFLPTLHQGLRLTAFIAVPASVGLLLVREPLTAVIYQRGQFTDADTARVAAIVAGYALAVWAYAFMHLLTRAFYALHDAKTPLRVSLAAVALNLALNLTLIWPLGTPGLALSTAIAAIFQALFLTYLLKRKLGQSVLAPDVLQSFARTLVASACMAAAVFAIVLAFDVNGLATSLFTLLTATASGILIYAAVVKLLRMPELTWLLRRQLPNTD